jgi:hypothetical protein
MSTLTKPEMMNSSALDGNSKNSVPTTEEPRSSYRWERFRREDEPLEEALEDSEPPEGGARFHPEAPDAGSGHLYPDDRELKHGRSRG